MGPRSLGPGSSVYSHPWVYDLSHTHSLASFQWSGLFDQQVLYLTENYLHILNWCPYKGRVVSAPNCEKWSCWCRPLHPAKAAAMCMACHDYAHPPPPIPCFFAGIKLIFKTDCTNCSRFQTTPKTINALQWNPA